MMRADKAIQLLAAIVSLALLSGQVYSAKFIHVLGGDPNAVSSDGSKVGGQSFYWTMEDGKVPFEGDIRSVSSDGSIMFGTDNDGVPFRWTPDSGIVPLGHYSGPFTLILGGSDDGSTAVGVGLDQLGQAQAFRWVDGVGYVGLGFAGGVNGVQSVAHAATADGSIIVGWSSTDWGGSWVHRWSETEGWVELGPIVANETATAYGTSPDGTYIVGQVGKDAFRWTEQSGIVNIGRLREEGGSEAFDVSADGNTIVGGHSSSTYGREAFIWTVSGGMRLLKEYIEQDLGIDVGGNYVEAAVAISDDGKVIVGGGGLGYILLLSEVTPEEIAEEILEALESPSIPTGTANSLSSKIDGVLASLESGDVGAAVNKLGAFINQVNAQRGKKLSEEDADALIASAESIQDSLSGVEALAATERKSRKKPSLAAFPNPANPATTILLTMPESGPVNLTIYNLLGQEVRQLTRTDVHSDFSVRWDGRDNYGREVTSGVYLVRLQTRFGTALQKVTILK